MRKSLFSVVFGANTMIRRIILNLSFYEERWKPRRNRLYAKESKQASIYYLLFTCVRKNDNADKYTQTDAAPDARCHHSKDMLGL